MYNITVSVVCNSAFMKVITQCLIVNEFRYLRAVAYIGG